MGCADLGLRLSAAAVACECAESVVRFAYFYKWKTNDARDRVAADSQRRR